MTFPMGRPKNYPPDQQELVYELNVQIGGLEERVRKLEMQVADLKEGELDTRIEALELLIGMMAEGQKKE